VPEKLKIFLLNYNEISYRVMKSQPQHLVCELILHILKKLHEFDIQSYSIKIEVFTFSATCLNHHQKYNKSNYS